MPSIPYPSKNSIIVFREPFYRKKISDNTKYYIRACVNGEPEQEIIISTKQQRAVVDQLIREDRKLTNAVVGCENKNFVILKHSPQGDFFELVKEKKYV